MHSLIICIYGPFKNLTSEARARVVILTRFDVELFRTALPALRVVFVGHVARNVEAVAVIRQLTTLGVWHPVDPRISREL